LNIYDIDNVSFSYSGKFSAISGVSMTIAPGEKVALLGPNGSGKSTLLRMMDALVFPDSGEISFMGRVLIEDNLHDEANTFFRKNVALLFQNPEIQLFSPTVFDDVLFGPMQLGIPRDEALHRAEESLEKLRIAALRDRSTHELSIGEKKRVAIAGLLAIDPGVLLLDEPTAGLDPRSCRDLIDIISSAGESGKTIITATHDLHLADELSDKAFVFSDEKTIIASGATNDVLSDTERLREWNLTHIHRHKHGGRWHEHEHKHL